MLVWKLRAFVAKYLKCAQAQPGEQCDDGNLRSMDGCNGVCEASSDIGKTLAE